MTPNPRINYSKQRELKMPLAHGVLTQMPLVEQDLVGFFEQLANDPSGLNSPLLATLFRVLSRLEQKQRDRAAFAQKCGGTRELETIIEGLQS